MEWIDIYEIDYLLSLLVSLNFQQQSYFSVTTLFQRHIDAVYLSSSSDFLIKLKKNNFKLRITYPHRSRNLRVDHINIKSNDKDVGRNNFETENKKEK